MSFLDQLRQFPLIGVLIELWESFTNSGPTMNYNLDTQNTKIDTREPVDPTHVAPPSVPTIVIPKPVYLTGAQLADLAGHFTYKDNADSSIVIDPQWVADNIVRIVPKLIAPFRCHRKVAHFFELFWEEVASTCPEAIDVKDTNTVGGCWVPRHLLHNKSLGLSIHSFGMAFDINPTTLPYNCDKDLDPRVVTIAEKYGFYYGGNFQHPHRDPMHLQIGILC